MLHWHTIEGELALVVQGRAEVGLVGFPEKKVCCWINVIGFNISAAWATSFQSFQCIARRCLVFSNRLFTIYPLKGGIKKTSWNNEDITSLEPEGGVDFIAILGFSYESIITITSAHSLQPIPEDIDILSLGIFIFSLAKLTFSHESKRCYQQAVFRTMETF